MSNDLSLQLKERLLAEIRMNHGVILSLRLRIHQGDSDLLKNIARILDDCFPAVMNAAIQESDSQQQEWIRAACAQTRFRERVKQITMEAVYGESLSPPLRVLPDSAGGMSRMDSPRFSFTGPIHAVIFEFLPNVTNELYPLMIDSYVHNSMNRGIRRHVIGVYMNWLDENGGAARAIVFDEISQDIFETSFKIPLRIKTVHFLCISSQIHQRLSERLAKKIITQLNPYDGVKETDDKFACYQRWKQEEVPTPPTAWIERKSDGDLKENIAHCFNELFTSQKNEEIQLVLQPNRGTEGRLTKSFAGVPQWEPFLQANPDLLPHAESILREDDLLLRAGVGNIRIWDELDETAVFFDIRVNVSAGRAESGFLTKAPKGSFIATRRKGASIVEWKDRKRLRFLMEESSEPAPFDDSIWEIIKQIAERAAACFPACQLAGLDLRLVKESGPSAAVKAYVLDINPRPAGLSHACYIDTGEPGVTQGLWEYLDRNES